VSSETETEESNRVFLSYEDAVAMLPDGDPIHTFVNPGMNMLVGADWSRDSILEILKNGRPELSGDAATGMGHGLVAFRVIDTEADVKRDPVFIATKEEKKAE
jgi:hypothetical protein